jgi:hypothetical protein
MSLELNGTTGVQGNSGAFVSGTAVASTSGTSIDFTSIPSWVKRVTVMFNGVSTNGTSVPRVQLGAGSITTSGYAGVNLLAGAVSGSGTLSAGFDVNSGLTNVSNLFTGTYVFSLITGNTWVGITSLGDSFATTACFIQGSIALAGTLDRVRITTVNGTDTFDAGTVNIFYE